MYKKYGTHKFQKICRVHEINYFNTIIHHNNILFGIRKQLPIYERTVYNNNYIYGHESRMYTFE